MPTKWRRVTEERYDEMLNVLPPALWDSKGFLVGEPWIHRTCEISGQFRAAYAAFVRVGDQHFEATGPLTPAEYRAVNPRQLELEP